MKLHKLHDKHNKYIFTLQFDRIYFISYQISCHRIEKMCWPFPFVSLDTSDNALKDEAVLQPGELKIKMKRT